MPIYQYQAVEKGCDACRDGFEEMQSIKAMPLTQCPTCGQQIKKVPARCSGYVPLLSNSNLRDKGFTKLKNRGDGTYENLT